MIGQLEGFPHPVIAAINGVALGGGFELALGCHHRIAVKSSRWGLPEINLGLLPGAQGTQRLPRLVGADTALRIILEGTALSAAEGQQLGVFDEVVDSEAALLPACLKRIASYQAMEEGSRQAALKPHKLSLLAGPTLSKEAEDKVIQRLGKARMREAAAQAILRCVRAAALPFAEGMAVEKQQFEALLVHPQSAALQYLFFAERLAGKVADLPAKTPTLRVSSVGIVGAGLMGTGIAASFAAKRIPVVLVDVNASALSQCQKTLASIFGSKQGEALPFVALSKEMSAVGTCDLVIEAVFEDMDLKKETFHELDQLCKPTALLCSNTSALNIDEIAAVTKRPQQVMGLHFFSPANKMVLVEAVRGAKTGPTTIQTLMHLSKTIGKVPVLVGNCPGFVGNRLFGQYTAAADELVLRGVSPYRVDAVAEEWGMKMGPFAVNDLVGLDLRHRQRVKAKVADPAADFYDAVVESGRLGQKNRKGFYLYDETRRVRQQDAAFIETTIQKVAAHRGIAQDLRSEAALSNEDLVVHLFVPLIHEAFLVLQEGFAQRPSDIDLILVLGYGAPRWRGGPLWYAEHELGFARVLAALQARHITPSPLLVDLVQSGLSFTDFWKTYRPSARL